MNTLARRWLGIAVIAEMSSVWILLFSLSGCATNLLSDGLPDDGVSCISCHGSEDNPAPPKAINGSVSELAVGAHQAHLLGGQFRGAIVCAECHRVPESVVQEGHVDPLPAEVIFGILASNQGTLPAWNRESGTCSDVYCHGAVLAGGVNTTPLWTDQDLGDQPCSACHGSPPPAPHPGLTSCSRCHPDTVISDTNIDIQGGKHIDGVVQIGGGGSGPGHLAHTEEGIGPALGCEHCHFEDLSSFCDGEPFATTTVCDGCHSPDGYYDGLDDPVVGARANWYDGIYEEDSLALQAGKDRWCAGCHDLGQSVVNGVAAPPVAGDGTWGFFAMGHGRGDAIVCVDCHDLSLPHLDGVAGSYSSAADNYREAYRLTLVGGELPLVVPRYLGQSTDAYMDPPYYELCFACHNRYALLGSSTAPAGPYNSDEMRTNFRNDAIVIIPDGLGTDIATYSVGGTDPKNSHYTHLVGPPHFYDSDNDGTTDSFGTCVACHNVHGSSSAAMIRDGKLIANEPSLNFDRVRYDRHYDVVESCVIMTSDNVQGSDSHGGIMRANSSPASNGVCGFCHCGGAASDDPEYLINCYGPECMAYYRTWVTPPIPDTQF